jgi:hypothetical protein
VVPCRPCGKKWLTWFFVGYLPFCFNVQLHGIKTSGEQFDNRNLSELNRAVVNMVAGMLEGCVHGGLVLVFHAVITCPAVFRLQWSTVNVSRVCGCQHEF